MLLKGGVGKNSVNVILFLGSAFPLMFNVLLSKPPIVSVEFYKLWTITNEVIYQMSTEKLQNTSFHYHGVKEAMSLSQT